MLGPAAKRALKICHRYEIDMLIDHRTEAGTEQFLVAWRHYAETTWEPTTMLNDDGVPDWYFQTVMDWKSEDTSPRLDSVTRSTAVWTGIRRVLELMTGVMHPPPPTPQNWVNPR
ncbi:hypothetical protein PF007_g30632 [Phytophthora fragariae]|uniref:Chromo domain-containing protein n=1 Tax=Phytophthora fragariae TaxID=53985 RepID=A0A6A3PSL2_9STRA|nr:hypothetical protein PF007_g30632 [Phytophthora fragariae]